MTEHRSKNTLGRSVPIKTMTDVDEDGTSEDGSPRPVCSSMVCWKVGADPEGFPWHPGGCGRIQRFTMVCWRDGYGDVFFEINYNKNYIPS